jgi:Putative MetA-pathway of phenol degradation
MAVERAIAFLLICTSGVALAGPPFQTDDPEPVDLHHLEFYVASQQTLTAAGRSGTLPHLEFNYGAAPDLQLHLMTPLAFSHPIGDARRQGYGDTELGAKYRLVHEGDGTPMVGIFPTYVVPTGDQARGLGNGRYQVYLPVWLQKSWGKWTSYGGVGHWINHASGARNNWFSGGLIQRELSDQWTLGAELFHRTSQGEGQDASTGFNLGGVYNLNEAQHVLFSAGKGLQNASQTDKFSSYIGYQVVY